MEWKRAKTDMQPYLDLDKQVTFLDAVVMTDTELARVMLVKRPEDRTKRVIWRVNKRVVAHEIAWRRAYWKKWQADNQR